jgi:hypothetical protein
MFRHFEKKIEHIKTASTGNLKAQYTGGKVGAVRCKVFVFAFTDL